MPYIADYHSLKGGCICFIFSVYEYYKQLHKILFVPAKNAVSVSPPVSQAV